MNKVTDLRIIETKDGGDVVLKGNDLEMISGFQNMPYIALFGGNTEQNTTGPKTTEQTFDFWGNFLLHPTLQNIWFNSRTEDLLNKVALTPSGRIQIEQQVKKDLEFMQAFASVTVNVSLVSVDRIQINIILIEPGQLDSTELMYIWDATNAELSQDGISDSLSNFGVGLDSPLDFDL